VHLLLGRPLSGNRRDQRAADLQRGPNGRALIGDPRNDENRIVAQLQAIMIRFHNRIADRMPNATLESVRDQVRWHYQWVVINDFLPNIVARDVVGRVFPHLLSGRSIADAVPVLSATAKGLELMPVEFSVAAYRFGHSMIRPIYRLNETISRRPIFSTVDDVAADLGGMRPIPDDWAIDWQFFIDVDHAGAAGPPREPNPDDPIRRRPQRAYKIDTSVVGALGALPKVVASNPSSLAERNLIRGNDFGLPSGQTVARILGAEVISDDRLVLGKATKDDPKTTFTAVSPAFAGNVPLWAYVLSEAQVRSWERAQPGTDPDTIPIQLADVGGQLVAEVFAALLVGDHTSFLRANPGFVPDGDLVHEGRFGLAELINAALGRTPSGS
jgi:hypothetical protein